MKRTTMADNELNKQLLRAVEDGDLHKAEYLVESGASVNCKDQLDPAKHLLSFMGMSAQRRRGAIGPAETLNRGTHISGSTPLHIAATFGNVHMTEFLLKKGANVSMKNAKGYTPLHSAMDCRIKNSKDKISVVRLLLSESDSSSKDLLGRTPLHMASEKGMLDIVKELLTSKTSDASVQDKWGNTPLHEAAIHNHVKILEVLIENGAYINFRNDKGMTAKALARQIGAHDAESLLKKMAWGQDQLQTVKKLEDSERFKELLSEGSFKCYENRVSLCGACNVGKTSLASIIIGEEIPVRWKSTNGLVIHFGRYGIDLKKRKMIPLKQGTAGHEVLANVFRGHPDVNKSSNTSPPGFTKSQLKMVKGSVLESKNTSHVYNVAFSTSELQQTSPNRIEEDLERISDDSNEVINKTTTRTRSRIDISTADLASEFDLHQSILDEVRKGEYEMNIAPSDLIDFGGQRSNDMTHQLFIQRIGSFVLMINGQYDLDDELPEYTHEKMTSACILKHWVNSILTYCAGNEFLPQILFAATHSDKFSQSKKDRQRSLQEQIEKLFCKHAGEKHIAYKKVFFINGTDKNDPEIEKLKETLVNIAFKQPSWGQPLPMSWVPLELQISKLKASHDGLIGIQDIIHLNERNRNFALNDEELEYFLKCQHCLGKILYFYELGLDDFVILKPTFLVNILRSFITDEMFWPKNRHLYEIHEKMSKTGIISKEDLFCLWKQEFFDGLLKGEDVKEFILSVLVNLDILVEPKNYTGKNSAASKCFLVPCMIKEIERDEPERLLEKSAICLSYVLKVPAIPSSLYFKLIGCALSIWYFKETGCGKPLLYKNSAYLQIDDDNELKIFVEEDKSRIFVKLQNKSFYTQISQDVAASIQECFTFTLCKVLRFYYRCAGKDIRSSDIPSMIQIEVGYPCNNKICVLPLEEAKKVTEWTCEHHLSHKTKYSLFWVFDKTIHKGQCPSDCRGLFEEDLSQPPSDKQLVRLANKIGMPVYREFVNHLGLTNDNFDNIEKEYGKYGVHCIQTMALFEWKNKCLKDRREPQLKTLSKALRDIGDNRHHFCQLFRENLDFPNDDNIDKQAVPTDEVLRELTRHIGNCTVQLGIELGLSIPEIKFIMFKCADKGNLYELNYEILKTWKEKSSAKTLYILMQALWHVDAGGLPYLTEKYRGSFHFRRRLHTVSNAANPSTIKPKGISGTKSGFVPQALK